MRWAASDVSPSSHLAFHIPTLAGFCLLFVLFSCLVLLLWCVFGFLFCECLGIPNSPRSLDLDDRQGLIARSAMQQKKKSPRVSHSKHLPVFCFVLCFGFGGVCCFVVFLFPVLQVFGIPNSPRSLDLDDRQGFIASSAMQQKKKKGVECVCPAR